MTSYQMSRGSVCTAVLRLVPRPRGARSGSTMPFCTISNKWLRVVRAVRLQFSRHLTRKSVLVLCADHVSNTEGKCNYWTLSNLIGSANIPATSTKTYLSIVSPVPRPHPLAGRDGLVNEVEFLGLEAYYGMYNKCIILWC